MKFIILVLFIFTFAQQSIAQDVYVLPRTEVLKITDSVSKRVYELHIQKPKGYTKYKKYPVVYMTDSPYTFPIVVGAARLPINSGRMQKILFVGISWEEGANGSLSRQRDFTPTPSSPGYYGASGEAAAHLNFIKNDVFPLIENKYSANPISKTYIGNSFGGLFGAYILLNAPDTFDNYILGSPSLWWDNDYMLNKGFENNKLTEDYKGNIFISVGANEIKYPNSSNKDMVGVATQFYKKLQALDYKHTNIELRITPWANHTTAFPTTAIQGLWWLFYKDKSQ